MKTLFGKIKTELFKTDSHLYINVYLNDNLAGKLGVDFDTEYNRYSKFINNGKLAKIIYVNVFPSYTHQGIASLMLDKVINELKDYNLYLNVIPTIREYESSKYNNLKNATNSLIRLYLKHGFEIIPETCTLTMLRKLNF